MAEAYIEVIKKYDLRNGIEWGILDVKVWYVYKAQ